MPDTLVVVIIHKFHSVAIFPTHLSFLIELALSKNYWPRTEEYIRMGKERSFLCAMERHEGRVNSFEFFFLSLFFR